MDLLHRLEVFLLFHFGTVNRSDFLTIQNDTSKDALMVDLSQRLSSTVLTQQKVFYSATGVDINKPNVSSNIILAN